MSSSPLQSTYSLSPPHCNPFDLSHRSQPIHISLSIFLSPHPSLFHPQPPHPSLIHHASQLITPNSHPLTHFSLSLTPLQPASPYTPNLKSSLRFYISFTHLTTLHTHTHTLQPTLPFTPPQTPANTIAPSLSPVIPSHARSYLSLHIISSNPFQSSPIPRYTPSPPSAASHQSHQHTSLPQPRPRPFRPPEACTAISFILAHFNFTLGADFTPITKH